MNLVSQIGLINNPQDFTKLCNAALSANHGDDFLPIDDDRADRGNDGYIKSEKRLIACHCFKRVQNQSIERDISRKMTSDLQKAIALKSEGIWLIENWTFISNYPVPETTATKLVEIGKETGIDVAWRGPEYLADVLQRAKEVRAQFPNLEVSQVMEKLDELRLKIEDIKPSQIRSALIAVPRNEEEVEQLVEEKPRGWEYLLFGGVMLLGKQKLESKWSDFEIGYAPRTGKHLGEADGLKYLFERWSDLQSITDGAVKVLTDENKVKAFGPDGEPGDPDRIYHAANHIVNAYGQLIDWAASLRSVAVPDVLMPAYEAAANVARQPAIEFREFIDENVKQLDKIPPYLANEESHKGPLRIELTLTVTVDDSAISKYVSEVKKARKKLRL